MEKTELSDEAKIFVVQSLACFDSPSEVAKAVRDEFGVTITRQSIEFYDPTKRAGATLSEGYRRIFETTRATFLTDTAEIAVSHRSVRLRRYQRMADKAEGMGNLPLAVDILERAAKEMGKVYTNQREISGPEGKPIAVDGTIRVEFVSPTHADGEDPSGVPGSVDAGAV